MEFSYKAYQELLTLLQDKGYCFTDYHDYEKCRRCVILRHDVDNSPEQALRMAELEAELGVKSTYFVLLRTDFYNPASKKVQQILREIHALGHEVGLHFDEVAYSGAAEPLHAEQLLSMISFEGSILSKLCGFPITTVSMHRPSKKTLEADYQIPGLVNSYGKTFFRDFKYLSDSRRCWREPVMDIVRSGDYDRLHILTHAFWYHEQEKNIHDTVLDFIRSAGGERYDGMMDNITDLAAIVEQCEIMGVLP